MKYIAGGVALCLGLAGCPASTPEAHMARAKDFIAKRDHAGAALELKNVLQGNPNSAEARFLLGRELIEQGAPRLAEVELQRAYDARYDRDAVVPLLVKSQVLQGTPERISPQIAKTELRDPAANAELKYWTATAAFGLNKLDDALRLYRAAQLSVPDYAPARIGEARVNAMMGNADAASDELATVLEKDPKNVEALILEGDLLRAKGKAQDALAAYLAASEVNPGHLQARINLASSYVELHQLDKAADQIVVLKKTAGRDARVNYLDALVSFSRGDALHANDAIQRSLNDDPNSAAAQILSGAISLTMKQPAQAEIHLLEGIRMRPDSLYARRLLATLYLKQRQPNKAKDVLSPVLIDTGTDPTLLGLAGETAVQLGDYAAAGRFFAQLSKIDPTNLGARLRGAMTSISRGDETGGLAALEAAAKDTTANPSPDVALVVTYVNRQQYDKALASWNDLVKLAPDSPVTYNLRAAIDLGRNDRPAARKALEKALQLQPTFLPAAENLSALDEMDGNLDAARQRLRGVTVKDPKSMAALLDLARLESRHKSPESVVLPIIDQARKVAPQSIQPTTTLIAYYSEQNDSKRALAVTQDALNTRPQDVTLLVIVGDLQMKLGGIDQALVAYRQAVLLRPDTTAYQLRLAQAMVLANQPDQALPVFIGALRAKPDVLPVQIGAVASLLSTHHVDEANRFLAEVRKIAPKSPVLPELEADVKMAARQYADAASEYKKLQQASPSTVLLAKEVTALQAAGRNPEANAALADWLKTHPADDAVLSLDGDAALQTKDYPRAVKSYEAALRVRPRDPQLLNNLAFALSLQNDPKAIELAQQANDLAPNVPTYGDTLGWILVQQGQVSKGVDVLQRASAVAPKNQDIALHLAKAQIKDGHKDAARTTLQALIKVSPSTSQAKESRDLLATL